MGYFKDGDKLNAQNLEDFEKYILERTHPVGSYYWSDDSTEPSTLFGGTWERIKDRFIYALGDSGNVGDKGGLEKVVLDLSQMPSHDHNFTGTPHAHMYGAGTTNSGSGFGLQSGSAINEGSIVVNYNGSKITTETAVGGTISKAGGGLAHENMPPYQKAYCWKRIK